MTPRDWVERARRFYDDGLPAFDLPDDGRVLAVLEVAVALVERWQAWGPGDDLNATVALSDKLIAAVAALPGSDE